MSKVYRCYVEKKEGHRLEASRLLGELKEQLGLEGLSGLRIFNRYDIEGIDESEYALARNIVFSEPMSDDIYDEELPPLPEGCFLLGVAPLPGQFSQRADSCEQCISMLTLKERPLVQAARVYALSGELTQAQRERVEGYLINPIESMSVSMDKMSSLEQRHDSPAPVKVLEGFTGLSGKGLAEFLEDYGLAMDIADLELLRDYFKNEEKRDPSITELRLIDTYWSDHCRHTTFGTHLHSLEIDDPAVAAAFERYKAVNHEVYGAEAEDRPLTLMNLATIGMKALKKRGLLENLDESEEVNACSVRIKADIDGAAQDWLLMFKNETHNHPTEIEPFGGAATCLGGAIRDPLSGRSYVYQAMRVSGSGDPTAPLEQTIEGKLPQRVISTGAAAGFSSYGNQIGLATGIVHEYYHPGYIAKRMEAGAVVGAAPAENVVRIRPEAGDLIVLLGGRTGRDGCGGATGSSKSHDLSSLEDCAAEVQKGNAPEERKIQRLFKKPEVSRLIKRCNDFGAGGVSVAIGELADSLEINLDAVPKKYEGLDGTELAISESQERMAVVLDKNNAQAFIAAAAAENLEATVVAKVTDSGRLVMLWRGEEIVSLKRSFLDTNGAVRYRAVSVPKLPEYKAPQSGGSAGDRLLELAGSLNVCSLRGLAQRFDSTVGAGTVIMPYGGRYQLTPAQVTASLLPAGNSETSTCSVMGWGFNPYYSERNPFEGAAAAVLESLAKLVAAGCDYKKAYLSFQEYFERLGSESCRWGKPFSALLGAFEAQMGLGIASIGGKDSMSGSFLDMDVPPTLISFAIADADASEVISSEFKAGGRPVYLFGNPRLMDFEAAKNVWERYHRLCEEGKVFSGWALGSGGAAEGIFKMCLGNRLGFKAAEGLDADLLFALGYGGIVAECAKPLEGALLLGYTSDSAEINLGGGPRALDDYISVWESRLEGVFPTRWEGSGEVREISYDRNFGGAPAVKTLKPKALIPVFPGTNCEYDTERALRRAGAEAEVFVIRNKTVSDVSESLKALSSAIRSSNMLILPGGFSGGDEPDGSGKFIAAFFRNSELSDAVHELLYKKDGLMLGICNGFQALIKLGLLPYGEILPLDSSSPTLSFNRIGRHQSQYVTTRIASRLSPWLSKCGLGQLHTMPISHGEGRFIAGEAMLEELIEKGQIAAQYTDFEGRPSMDIAFNPSGSLLAIEAISSADGRILGKMGHSERFGPNVAKNIPGNKNQRLFEGGVAYFSL